MTSINPLHAMISDMSVVEQRMNFDALSGELDLSLTVSVASRLVDRSVDGKTLSVAVESDVSIGAMGNAMQDAVSIAKIVLGCTAEAPAEGRGPDSLAELERYAVETNIGFARALVYQQTAMSVLPSGLIIPPLVFDGEMEVVSG